MNVRLEFTSDLWWLLMVIYRERMGDYCETSTDALHFGDSKCVEVRLSLLEHHLFHEVTAIAAT